MRIAPASSIASPGAFVAVVRGRAPCEERHVPRRCGARRCGVEGDAAPDHAPASRLPQDEAVADVDHERVLDAHPHEQRAVGQPVEHADPGGGLGGAVMQEERPAFRDLVDAPDRSDDRVDLRCGAEGPRPCDDDATAQRRPLDPGEVDGHAGDVTRLVPRSLVRLQGAHARADVAGLER